MTGMGSTRMATSLNMFVKAAVSYILGMSERQPPSCEGSVPCAVSLALCDWILCGWSFIGGRLTQLSEMGLHWKIVANRMLIHQQKT